MKCIPIILIFLFVVSCNEMKTDTKIVENSSSAITIKTKNDSLIFSEERHFKSIRQVTFGGDNAEAYWSFDDKQLIFQSNYKGWGLECDQMFLMNADEIFNDSKPLMISTGKGRTTCDYFLPDNKHLIYA